MDIYYRERDENGIAVPYQGDDQDAVDKPEVSEEEQEETLRLKYFAMGYGLRMKQEQIDAGWQAYLNKKKAAKEASHGQGEN